MNITIDDFSKLEIRVGKIVSCEKVESADKLLKLRVDFGPEIGERQIISGIAQFYTPEDLVGKQSPFLVNLEPRVIRGLESQGMIMAANDSGKAVLLHPDEDIPAGSLVK